jgi:hypothetical protein
MWGYDWAWGIPMLLGSLAFHVSGLVALEGVLRWFERRRKRPRSITYFLVLMLFTANTALLLHVLEVGAWAYVYLRVGAVDDLSTALLFSLNAMTSYGHDQVQLKDQWRLLGAIESMNGVMIFGLTTAFLFNAMTQLRPVRQG